MRSNKLIAPDPLEFGESPFVFDGLYTKLYTTESNRSSFTAIWHFLRDVGPEQ